MKASFVALMGLSASISWAQAPAVLTLDEAIRIALENNNVLEQASIASALDEVAVGDARSAFVPHLDASASASESYGRAFSEREGRLVNDTTRSASLGASTGISLFNGFRDIAALRSAQFAARAGQWDLARARDTVISIVTETFYAYLTAQDQIRVRQESLASEVKLKDQIEIYIEGGSRTRADLYTQEVTVANARLALSEAERVCALARFDLLQVLGLPPASSHQFASPSAGDEVATSFPSDVQVLVGEALAQRKDLHAEEARVRSAEQAIRLARSARWPSLALGAGYGSGFTDASSVQTSEQLELNRGGSMGISLSFPLFDGGQAGRAARRAQLQVRLARVVLEASRRAVEQEVQRAYLDLRIARQQLELAEISERAAALALNAAEDRYRLGAATLVELSQARAADSAARTTLVSAHYDLKRRMTMLQFAVGGPLSVTTTTENNIKTS